jgi:hypothetical protein
VKAARVPSSRCLAALAGACLITLAFGGSCLNPRPDDQPSAFGAPGNDGLEPGTPDLGASNDVDDGTETNFTMPAPEDSAPNPQRGLGPTAEPAPYAPVAEAPSDLAGPEPGDAGAGADAAAANVGADAGVVLE